MLLALPGDKTFYFFPFSGIIKDMTESIFINISIVLSIAIALSFIIRLLRQPMIIAYILTGIICGPLFLNLINSQQEFFDVFA